MIATRLRETRYWIDRQQRNQRARFDSLALRLQSMAQSCDDHDSLKCARLAKLSASRRGFTERNRRPRVIAFGADDWERYGLWPAMSKATDFTLWEHQSEVPVGQTDDTYRSRVARKFLQFVDQEDAKSVVSCVFFYAAGSHISSELLESLHSRGIWTVVLGLDDKHQLSDPVDAVDGMSNQLRVALKCDLYWTTWSLAAKAINSTGGAGWFAPPGGDPEFFRPLQRPKDIDLLFVGSRYGHRGPLVSYLRSKGLKVNAYGRGWGEAPPDFASTLDLFSRSRVVIGNGSVGYMNGVRHLKGRDFEVPMAGAVYLTTTNPELSQFFEVGEEILCYDSFADCADIAHDILDQKSKAQRIRENARERCVRDHTWDSRLSQLFSQLTQV
ncbi:MAG: glycosyltransferase [Gemmatimonadaceae bacterium]